jgi:hypothetical protein
MSWSLSRLTLTCLQGLSQPDATLDSVNRNAAQILHELATVRADLSERQAE